MKRTLVVAMLMVGLLAVVLKVAQAQHSTAVTNQALANHSGTPSLRLMADGNPAPPFPPSPAKVSGRAGGADISPKLTADGNPAPPFPPMSSAESRKMVV